MQAHWQFKRSPRWSPALALALIGFLCGAHPVFSQSVFPGGSAAATSRPEPLSAPTIGHEVLRMERTLGATRVDERTLNALIERAGERIQSHDKHGARRARQALREIESILRDHGLQNGNSSLLHGALRSGRADCDTRTIIYLSIGESLNLPLVAARVDGVIPGHVIVRWRLSRHRFVNWETLAGIEFDASGKTLTNLSRDELLAIQYFNLGIDWARRSETERALTSFAESVARDDSVAVVHASQAEALLRRSVESGSNQPYTLNLALLSVNRALELEPSYSDAYVLRSIIQHHRDRPVRSKRDAQTAVRLDRRSPAARYYLGLALVRNAKVGTAIDQFSRAVGLGSRSGDSFSQRLVLDARLRRALAYEERARRRPGHGAAKDRARAADDAMAVLNARPDHRQASELMARLALQDTAVAARSRIRAAAILRGQRHASPDK